MKNTDKKLNLTLLVSLCGVAAILAGISTFLGIYFSTPDYRLIKNDYDIYLNKDKVNPSELDDTYTYKNDPSFFTFNSEEIVIDIDAIKNDNPSFISSTYKIDIAFSFEIIGTIDNIEFSPELFLTIHENEPVKIRCNFKETNTFSNIKLGKDIEQISFKILNYDSENFVNFTNSAFKFYSLME